MGTGTILFYCRSAFQHTVVPGHTGTWDLDDQPSRAVTLVRTYEEECATVLTQTGEIVGTFSYLPPEVLLNEEATPQSDLFQLGVLFYELLTGQLPFPYNVHLQIIHQRTAEYTSATEHRKDVDEGLDELIHSLLKIERKDRLSSARELIAALDNWSVKGPAETERNRPVSLSRGVATVSVERQVEKRRPPFLPALLFVVFLALAIYRLWPANEGEGVVLLSPERRAKIQIQIQSQCADLKNVSSWTEGKLESLGLLLKEAGYHDRLKVDKKASTKTLALVHIARLAQQRGQKSSSLLLYEELLTRDYGSKSCQGYQTWADEYARTALSNSEHERVFSLIEKTVNKMQNRHLQQALALAMVLKSEEQGKKEQNNERKDSCPNYQKLHGLILASLKELTPEETLLFFYRTVDFIISCGGRDSDEDIHDLATFVEMQSPSDWRIWYRVGEASGFCFSPKIRGSTTALALLDEAIKRTKDENDIAELNAMKNIFFSRILFNRYQNKWDGANHSELVKEHILKESENLDEKTLEFVKLSNLFLRTHIEVHLGTTLTDKKEIESAFAKIDLKKLHRRHQFLYYIIQGDLFLANQKKKATTHSYRRAYDLCARHQRQYVLSVIMNFTVHSLFMR